MQARELLRQQFNMTHQFLDMTMGDVSQEAADKKIDGSTINTLGQIFGHIVLAEDSMVGGVRGETVLSGGDWQSKTGLNTAAPMQDDDWAKQKINLAAIREYGKAVFAATDDFLANAADADLETEVDTPMGKQPALAFLGGIGLTHVAQHWGEVAALKGVQGMKGLPF